MARDASEIINKLFANLDPGEAKMYHDFFNSWKKAAGEDIASHSNIRDIVNSSVLVEVDHPGWKQMLLMRKKQILGSLTKMFPQLELKSIKVILVDTLNKNPEPKKEESPVNPLPEPEVEVMHKRDTADPENEKDTKKRFESALNKLKHSIQEDQK